MQRYIFKLALLAFMVLTLPANAQTYVLDESFEGNMFPPDGWSVIDADGDGHCWQQGGTGLTRGSGDKIAVSIPLTHLRIRLTVRRVITL